MNNNADLLAKSARLQARIAGLSLEIDALHSQLVCEVCVGKDDIGIRPIMFKGPICKHCFTLWYDSGVTDPERMRIESLQKQGRTETVNEGSK
jgi:hypothetical protein